MEIGKVFKNFHEIIIDPHKDRTEISKKGAWALSIICAIPLGIPHIISAVVLRKNTDINATQLKIKSIWQKKNDEKSYRDAPYIAKLSSVKPLPELAKEIIEDISEFSELMDNNITDDLIPDLLGFISDKLSKINYNLSEILQDQESRKLLEENDNTKKIVELNDKMSHLGNQLIREVLVNKSPEENLNAVTDLLNENKMSLETFINTPKLLNSFFLKPHFQHVIYLYIKKQRTLESSQLSKIQINVLTKNFYEFKLNQLFDINNEIAKLPNKNPQLILSLVHTCIKPLSAKDLLENAKTLKYIEQNKQLHLILQLLSTLQREKTTKSEKSQQTKEHHKALQQALELAKEHALEGKGLATELGFKDDPADFQNFYKSKRFKFHPDHGGDEELFKKLLIIKKMIDKGVYKDYREKYLELKGSSSYQSTPSVSAKSDDNHQEPDSDLIIDPDSLD